MKGEIIKDTFGNEVKPGDKIVWGSKGHYGSPFIKVGVYAGSRTPTGQVRTDRGNAPSSFMKVGEGISTEP